jgi:hypothetical protein
MNDGAFSPQLRLSESFERGRVTSISSAPQRRPITLVLGMHRSGTSLCSHVLSVLGVDMADQIAPPGYEEPAPDNQRGHWERWEIVTFHDRILELFNRGYATPFHDFPLPVAWWADPRIADIRREIAAFLEKRMGNRYFGFKDPRTVRLMPVWHQLVNELGLAPKILFCLRNPAQVARSLHVREGLPVENGEYRWLSYVVDFFRDIRGLEFCTIEYEAWFEDPALNLLKLRNFLDLPAQQADVDLAIWEIIDPELRHDDLRGGEARQPLVRSVYKLARRAEHDPAARDQVQNVAAQFRSFQQLQGAFQRAFERTAAIAERLPSVEQEAAALRERVAAAASEEERANAAEAGLAEALAQIEAQRSRLTGIERELDDRTASLQRAEQEAAEAGTAVAAAQSEIVALREAVMAAEHETRQSASAALTLRGEAAILRRAAVEAERELGERTASAEGTRAELAMLRESMARTEQDAQQYAINAEAMRNEIKALRHAATKADTEAKARGADAEALRGEIRDLCDTLTAARQVGQAAMKALAADVPATIPREEPIGWWWAMKRRFGFAGIA